MQKSHSSAVHPADDVDKDKESSHSQSASFTDSFNVFFSTFFCTVSQNSKRFRQFYFLQMLFLPFIPILALLGQNIHTMINYMQHQESMTVLQTSINDATEVGRVLSALQTERSEVTFYVLTNGSVARNHSNVLMDNKNINGYAPADISKTSLMRKRRYGELNRIFHLTDMTIDNITNWNDIARLGNVERSKGIFSSKLRFQISLEDLRIRESINKSMSQSHQQIEWYYTVDEVFLEVMGRRMTATSLSSSSIRSLLTYVNLIRAIEYFGVLMDYGLRYLRIGELSGYVLLRAVRSDTLFWEYINNTRSFSTDMFSRIHMIIDRHNSMPTVLKVRSWMMNDVEKQQSDVIDPSQYYLSCVTLVDELRSLQLDLANAIGLDTQLQLSSAFNQQLISIVTTVVIILLSPIIIVMVHRTSNQMEIYAECFLQKAAEAKREKRKTDQLLCQLLPANVIQQLKSTGKVLAESFDAVTIYFSDIVGFTNIASQSTPIQVVTFLNSLYKLFDIRTDRYDIYKVETIGDAYMCVSGLPKRNGDLHASEIADMSLDILLGIAKYQIPHLKYHKVSIRIGMHTGPCVAGVVGIKMPRYCLFGDTINIASSLEATGKPQMVHMSDNTHAYLNRTGRYITEYRGKTNIKDRVEIDTYWLLDRKNPLPTYVEPSFNSESCQPDYIAQMTFSRGPAADAAGVEKNC